MTDNQIIHIGLQTMTVAAKLGAPVLLTALLIGFAVSLFQSVTQIQEFTLSFVPKVVGVGVALLLASVRAAAWLVVSPPFNSSVIPAQIKALLSVAIAVPVVPSLVTKVPSLDDTASMIVSCAEQVVLGTALGFLTALLFAAVSAAGNLIDLFGGLSLAFAFDPMGASGNAGSGIFWSPPASPRCSCRPSRSPAR